MEEIHLVAVASVVVALPAVGEGDKDIVQYVLPSPFNVSIT